MVYRRAQRSVPMLVAVGTCLVVLGVTTAGGGPTWVLLTLAVVAVVLLVASRLVVTVEPSAVTAAFGVGWPRRTIPLAQVDGIRVVRTEWWSGWGIRKIAHGWMFNNAGRTAVELDLGDGRVFRIGTDDPDGLTAALTRVAGV